METIKILICIIVHFIPSVLSNELEVMTVACHSICEVQSGGWMWIQHFFRSSSIILVICGSTDTHYPFVKMHDPYT